MTKTPHEARIVEIWVSDWQTPEHHILAAHSWRRELVGGKRDIRLSFDNLTDAEVMQEFKARYGQVALDNLMVLQVLMMNLGPGQMYALENVGKVRELKVNENKPLYVIKVYTRNENGLPLP